MPLCCAPDCKNQGRHIFPKDPKRRQSWEKALRIKNFKATNYSVLCYAHFKADDYYGQSKYTQYEPRAKFLKKTAVPSIFSFTKPKPETTTAARQRQERFERRSRKKLRLDEAECPQQENEMCTSDHIEEIELCNEVEISTEVEEIALSSAKPILCSKGIQVGVEDVFGTINRYKTDDKGIKFYTGFESYKKFYFVYSTLSPVAHKIKYFGSQVINISTEDQFFLTLMKLRQNKCIFELSRFFSVSTTTVSNIFITWINFIYQMWSKINIWPDKDLVQYYMPDNFKKYNVNVRVILDGTEINVQKPKHPTAQQASWSSYKHGNNLKVLVGATPGGLLSYCSPAYAGSVSDRQTVERCDLIQKCESGDVILADRGFNIQDMLIESNIAVHTPTFLKGQTQLPGLSVLKDRALASKRVHIERLIGLTKTYKILKSELDHNYVPIASKIFFICMMCCNFRESIIKNAK